MGNYWTSTRSSTEEAEAQSSSGAYRFPPKNGGPYFSNHFIMGGEKFDTPQPEAFLFGENTDLNFLGTRPAPFPYPPPQATEPTKTLRSLINIRRDSVHLVPLPGQPHVPQPPHVDSEAEEDQQQRVIDETQRIWGQHRERKFNIQFTFDSDVRCAITIYYMSTEEITSLAATYTPAANGFKSETYYYKRGVNQVFSQPAHVFHPGMFKDDELHFRYNEDNATVIPVAIQCVALDGDTPRQAHTTVASVERASDGSYVIKNIKQKLFVDGLSYLLQEIYGLENKMTDLPSKLSQFDEDVDDCGADCVVCMCDLRDTIILPCRHLCLCYACAESLRYQASNCPICRAPFIALLQIRAVQRMSHATHPALAGTEPTVQEGVPPGYTGISLVEALNGATTSNRDDPPQPVMSLASAEQSDAATAAVAVRHGHGKKTRGKRRGSKESSSSRTRQSTSTSSQLSSAPATAPLQEEPESNDEETETAGSATSEVVPPIVSKPKSADTNVKVSLKIVNEVEKKGASPGKKSPPPPPANSMDIVEEELAKMAEAESLTDLSVEVTDTTRLQELEGEDIDDEEEEDELDDETGEEGDDERDEEDNNDEAVVVNLPIIATTVLPGARLANSSLPGTPMSNASEVSSQNSASSSGGSTKQLLPKASVPAGKNTPVQSESSIVKVVPKLGEGANDDDDDGEDENLC